jgi:hypothetical protein
MKKFMPDRIVEEIHPDLYRLGHKAAFEYQKYHEEGERVKPVLEKYDAWGKYHKKLYIVKLTLFTLLIHGNTSTTKLALKG